MSVFSNQNQKDLIKLNDLNQSFEIIDFNNTTNVSSNRGFDIFVFYSDYNISINQSLLYGYLNLSLIHI